MRLHLGGHLNWYDPQKRSWLDIPLAQPTSLLALLQQIGVPSAEIAIAAVNRVSVPLEEAQVSDNDHVELYPPVGGGQP